MICPSCYWSDNCKGVINEEEFQAESFGAECTGVESGGYHEWGSYPAEVHQVSYDGQDGRLSALVNVTNCSLIAPHSLMFWKVVMVTLLR